MIFQRLKDWWRGTSPLLGGAGRYSKWPAFKIEFEKNNPKQCAVCGNKKVSLHHIVPFNKDPAKELDKNNTIWLCDGLGTLQHHRGMGHYGSFLSWNSGIISDVFDWKIKFENRP